jgi:hypothetical protein
MYIGLGIFLLVVGAIIEFAYTGDASLGGVLSIHAIGWICIVAGILAIVLSLVMSSRRTGGYSARRVTHTDPTTGSRVDDVDVDPNR